MNYYSLFHFTIASSIKFDVLRSISKPDKLDVFIETGTLSNVPESEIGWHNFGNCKYNKENCFFELPEDNSKFLIEKCKSHIKVVIDFKDPEYRQTLLSYFFASGLSAIIHFQGLFLLHSSGVSKGNGLILFCGPSGIGKSTIAAHLKTKGYPLFTDDKCLLIPSGNGKWTALPGLNIMRLWQNSIDALDTSTFLHNPKEVELKKDKFQFYIKSQELISEEKHVKAIFIIQNLKKGERIGNQELQGLNKIKKIKSQIFRVNMVSGMGLDQKLWTFLTNILNDIPVYSLQRPLGTSIDNFGEYVEEMIDKL
ncbi:MAG: hypothetical protein ACJA01_003011 [Saprospiraceae bacterium]